MSDVDERRHSMNRSHKSSSLKALAALLGLGLLLTAASANAQP